MSCPRCGSANDPDTVICRGCGALLLRVGALPDGFVIALRYQIVRRIGAGGMGMV